MMCAIPEKRRITLVSFSGIDGAGKSTQIEALRARMEEVGLCVLVITFWDDVARLKRIRETTGHIVFKGDKGVGTPAEPIVRRDKNVRSWWMTCVRLGLYFLDAVSLRSVVKKALCSRADFVIFDRYIYDELANLALDTAAARLYVALLLKLVPKPHLIYLLDADPVQAFERKPEYPLAFLFTSRASYLALSKLAGGLTVIPPMPAREVEREILKYVLKSSTFAESRDEQAKRLRTRNDGEVPV
jgi:thymidylate kinase